MTKRKLFDLVSDILLILIILIGISCRFYNMNWDSGALLHPDEYGLTNTISQLHMPSSFSEYFNTRISPVSPYDKYDTNGEKIANGPDNTMRWGQFPIILIRLTAEAFGTTGFHELRLTGRYMVAILDVFSLLLLYLIGKRLFDHKVALTAVALSSLAVQQIQQSHFMTVDNFAVFFTMLTLYVSVIIAFCGMFERDASLAYRMTKKGWLLSILFGVCLGMTMSCKINLAVLGIMLAPAVFISTVNLKLHSRADFSRILTLAVLSALTAIAAMLLTVRVCQPMTFRATQGDTSFFTFHINADWWRSMQVAASESSGIGGGPPSEQWAHRTAILFPLINMVLYGMGAPLGITVWVCAILGCIRLFRPHVNDSRKALLIPLFWSIFFFLFMGTRFVKNNRYFLPIYPMLCLLAAWGLLSFIRSAKTKWRTCLSYALILVVFCGTCVWTHSFVKTIYGQLHSRVEATNWILDNIPALFHLSGTNLSNAQTAGVPIAASDSEMLSINQSWERSFQTTGNVHIDTLILPHASSINGKTEQAQIHIEIVSAEAPALTYAETESSIEISSEESQLEIPLKPFDLEAGKTYIFRIILKSGSGLRLRRAVIANENWDEGLPFRTDTVDPFGQMYKGITNEVRWYDNDEKREMFIDRLTQADYLILPSQRAIWSVCRIPRTYPMTMAYYQALFNGELGFELVKEFQRPFSIGPFKFSDLTGELKLEEDPQIPVNYRGIWGAEEAFSVYDHPPVWIFKKTADFSVEKLEKFFAQFDLSTVVVEGPTNAHWD